MPLRKSSQAGRYRREGGIGFPSMLQKRRLQPRKKQGPIVCNKQVIVQSEDSGSVSGSVRGQSGGQSAILDRKIRFFASAWVFKGQTKLAGQTYQLGRDRGNTGRIGRRCTMPSSFTSRISQIRLTAGFRYLALASVARYFETRNPGTPGIITLKDASQESEVRSQHSEFRNELRSAQFF
jgi:hypothetical protein